MELPRRSAKGGRCGERQQLGQGGDFAGGATWRKSKQAKPKAVEPTEGAREEKNHS